MELSGQGRVHALIELFHPVPVLLTLIGTAVFALLAAGPRIDGRTLALILAIVMLSQVAIAVFNDICDQDLDAARTPGRALPRGAIRQSTALLLVVVSTGVCLTLSAQLGLASFLMVAVGTGLGLAYSVWLKRSAWSWLPFAVAFPLLPAWIIHVLAPDGAPRLDALRHRRPRGCVDSSGRLDPGRGVGPPVGLEGSRCPPRRQKSICRLSDPANCRRHTCTGDVPLDGQAGDRCHGLRDLPAGCPGVALQADTHATRSRMSSPSER